MEKITFFDSFTYYYYVINFTDYIKVDKIIGEKKNQPNEERGTRRQGGGKRTQFDYVALYNQTFFKRYAVVLYVFYLFYILIF